MKRSSTWIGGTSISFALRRVEEVVEGVYYGWCTVLYCQPCYLKRCRLTDSGEAHRKDPGSDPGLKLRLLNGRISCP